MRKYNYVIFSSENDYFAISFREIDTVDYARFIPTRLDSKSRLLTLIYKLHCSQTTEKIINLPFKKIWNGLYFKNKFNNDNPICFIFLVDRYLNRIEKRGYAEYLRKHYPDCKLVAFFQDLVKKEKSGTVEMLKDKMDAILSFDQRDSEEYGLIYYPLVYTPEEYLVKAYEKPSDVYFVGYAKNRFDDIISAYEQLTSAELICDFHIIGVPEEERKYADKIVYRDIMPYVENISHIKATKCMLEIMQKGGHGYTLRLCEAVTYGKRMITNNPEIAKTAFYSPKLISLINDGKIDTEFVSQGEIKVDYGFKEQLSPLKLLDFIEEIFREKK